MTKWNSSLDATLWRSAHRLSMNVRLGRLTHANSARAGSSCLCREMLVSTRMFIGFMGTVNCSYTKYWHPSASFLTSIKNKSMYRLQKEMDSCFLRYKINPQSYFLATSLVSSLSLPCAFIDFLLLQQRGKAGRGNFSFAVVNIRRYKHLQLFPYLISKYFYCITASVVHIADHKTGKTRQRATNKVSVTEHPWSDQTSERTF